VFNMQLSTIFLLYVDIVKMSEYKLQAPAKRLIDYCVAYSDQYCSYFQNENMYNNI
jgi:hypothetical protein